MGMYQAWKRHLNNYGLNVYITMLFSWENQLFLWANQMGMYVTFDYVKIAIEHGHRKGEIQEIPSDSVVVMLT